MCISLALIRLLDFEKLSDSEWWTRGRRGAKSHNKLFSLLFIDGCSVRVDSVVEDDVLLWEVWVRRTLFCFY